jgi:hemoglobin
MQDGRRAAAERTPYEAIGGAAVVRALVDAFYDRMDRDPAYAGIRALHPRTLEGSREKLFLFLSGWLGGPQLYVERHGHPRLRARHLPFSIGTAERDQWLACMADAVADAGIAPDLAAPLGRAFADTADFLRNRAD